MNVIEELKIIIRIRVTVMPVLIKTQSQLNYYNVYKTSISFIQRRGINKGKKNQVT